MTIHKAGRKPLDFAQSVLDTGSGEKSGKNLLGGRHNKGGSHSFDQHAPDYQANSGKDLTGGTGSASKTEKSQAKSMPHVNDMPAGHSGSIGNKPAGV